MSEFKTTRDYSIFKHTKYNRDLKPNNVARVQQSIEEKNMLPYNPIIVDKNMRVIDGQNRLEAAKNLGLEISYIVDENANHSDILLYNLNQSPWKLEDFLKYYIASGNEEYMGFKEFIEKHDISIRVGLRLLAHGSGNACRDFRRGKFKFPPETEIQRAVQILENYHKAIYLIQSKKAKGYEITKVGRFCDALMLILNAKNLDFKVFLAKLQYKLESLHLCATSGEYHEMLKQIYNWKNKTKLEMD